MWRFNCLFQMHQIINKKYLLKYSFLDFKYKDALPCRSMLSLLCWILMEKSVLSKSISQWWWRGWKGTSPAFMRPVVCSWGWIPVTLPRWLKWPLTPCSPAARWPTIGSTCCCSSFVSPSRVSTHPCPTVTKCQWGVEAASCLQTAQYSPGITTRNSLSKARWKTSFIKKFDSCFTVSWKRHIERIRLAVHYCYF